MSLTREKILTLQGRELDAAVAEHILGWTDIREEFVRGYGCPGEDLLFGQEPGAPMREVVDWFHSNMDETMKAVRACCATESAVCQLIIGCGTAQASFHKPYGDGCICSTQAETVEVAACRACLLLAGMCLRLRQD